MGIFLIASVYATTTITDNKVTARNFNMSGGRFTQEADILSEVGYIQDDSEGGIATGLDGVRGVYVQGNYAYITGKDNESLSVIDISDPTAMFEVGVIFDDSTGGTANCLDKPLNVYVSGKYAYVVTATDHALSIIDISNPSNLTEVGCVKDTSTGGTATGLNTATALYVSGKYAYVLGKADDALSIIDVSNPTNPIEVAALIRGGATIGLDDPTGIYVSGRYAYVASQAGDGSMSIIDVLDPLNPVEVGIIQDAVAGGNASVLGGAQAVYVLGRYAYVSSYANSSLTIVDVSNASNPFEISYIQDESKGGEATAIDGFSEIYVSGKYAYMTSLNDDAISVFDISNASNIVELDVLLDDSQGGEATNLEASRGLFVSGKYAYVTSRDDAAFTVIDLSGVETPLLHIGNMQANFLRVIANAYVDNDLYVRSGLVVGASAFFMDALSVYGTFKVIGNGNFTGNLSAAGNQGITGNYTDGNCWTAYSGGIIYGTNCTIL
jgi:hypothetical protein